MSVMSYRVLRSNTKALPEGSVASVKKSRKVILQSFDELSNTPKESENEEVYKKKIMKKRIRRTDHSFHIDDLCKGETTLNEQYNTESSKAKTKKLRRNDSSSSSGDDSVFKREGISSKTTRKTKKKYKLPTIQLNDFQQYSNKKQTLRQESNGNNSKSSKEFLHKNKMEKKTPKQKSALVPSGVKKKLRSNTSSESIYFTPLPMKINQLPNSTELMKCENNSEFKTETYIEARKPHSRNSEISNGFLYDSSTSEETDLKKEHQGISVAIKKRISFSNESVNSNGYFCTETITTPLKPSFSDDSSEMLNLSNSHISSFKQNTHVQDVSNHVEKSSDSEIEFDCCPKDPGLVSSDFPMMVQNGSVEESSKIQETTANNSKKIWVQTKINSRTDTKNPNISMRVATVSCGDVNLDNRDISIGKKNENVPGILGRRERKRWTILRGNEAKKSFNSQMDLLRSSLLISRNNRNSPNKNDMTSRRSVRKRWSDELRKSVSALDISKNSKHNVDLKINSHSEDKLENSSQGNRLSTNSRRSRFSSSSSIDKSISKFPKTIPNASIDNLSKSNINCSKRRTFEIQKNVGDSASLMSTTSKLSNGRRSRFSSSSSIDRSTSEFPKTTPNVSVDNLSKSNINCSKRRTFEIEKNVGDSPLLLSTSSKISNVQLPKFSSSSSIDRSATEFPKTTPNVSIENLSKSNINCSRRRTYEIQKNEDDSPLLMSTTSILSNGRRSRFLSDSTVNTSAVQCPKKSVYDSTLLMPNSSTSNERDFKDPVILNRRDTYEIEESVADVSMLRALSESTLTDIGVGVLPAENSVDFSTNKKVNFENVTRRKAFDRSAKEMEVANGHTSLINKSSKRVCFKTSAPKKRSTSLEKPFSPRTFISSTPKCGFQSSSAQKSIITDKHLPLSRRRSKSADEGNTRITRIRMPNFAKIYQKASEKMKNIVQLTERKAERAKLLLSGQKPNDSHGVSNSDNNVKDVKRSHKQLTFDSSKPSTSRGFLRVYQDITKKDQLKNPGTKIPVLYEPKSELSKDENLKVAVSEKQKNVGKTRLAKALSLKKVTQFGFKIKSDACSENKTEQIKALAAKTKVKQDNRAEQRSIVKGVRSNKRFELLMKMRKK